mgnify:CR=1 FL=1
MQEIYSLLLVCPELRQANGHVEVRRHLYVLVSLFYYSQCPYIYLILYYWCDVDFWDHKGKRYTDVNSQLMCCNVGHQHPKIIQAIKDQADELMYAGPSMATRVRAELGKM